MSSRPLRASWVPVRPLAPDTYRCQRCGIQKKTKPARPRPTLCGDCIEVEATDPNAINEDDLELDVEASTTDPAPDQASPALGRQEETDEHPDDTPPAGHLDPHVQPDGPSNVGRRGAGCLCAAAGAA